MVNLHNEFNVFDEPVCVPIIIACLKNP